MKLLTFVLGAALLVSGCASMSPYRHPPAGASEAERQKTYEDHAVTYNVWTGLNVGGKALPPQFKFVDTVFADYFDASGDTASAALARKVAPYRQAGLWIGMSGLLVALALPREEGHAFSEASYIAFGSGLVAEAVIVSWGASRSFLPSIDSFNHYLKQDVGREGPGPSSPAPDAPREKNFSSQSWLFQVAGGGGFAIEPERTLSGIRPGQRPVQGVFEFSVYQVTDDRRGLIGLVESGVLERLEDSKRSGTDHLFVGLSSWRSLQGAIGDGAFIRGSLGLAEQLVVEQAPSTRSFVAAGIGSEMGLGTLFGRGPEHRYSLTLLYSPSLVEGEIYQNLTLRGGLLW